MKEKRRIKVSKTHINKMSSIAELKEMVEAMDVHGHEQVKFVTNQQVIQRENKLREI